MRYTSIMRICINHWGISLQKQFSIRERMTLQLRADSFNTFKPHPIQRD